MQQEINVLFEYRDYFECKDLNLKDFDKRIVYSIFDHQLSPAESSKLISPALINGNNTDLRTEYRKIYHELYLLLDRYEKFTFEYAGDLDVEGFNVESFRLVKISNSDFVSIWLKNFNEVELMQLYIKELDVLIYGEYDFSLSFFLKSSKMNLIYKLMNKSEFSEL